MAVRKVAVTLPEELYDLIERARAIDDLRRARDHDATIDEALGDAFRDQFDQVIERLEMFPRSGRPVEGVDSVRRARLRRFPSGVFYRLAEPDELRVLRVLHTRRDHLRALA